MAAEASHSLADTANDLFLLGYPGVTAIREVLVTFTGPGRAWVTARLDIDDELSGAQVKSLVRGIEWGMKRESEAVYRSTSCPSAERPLRLGGSVPPAGTRTTRTGGR
jgi:hypothetical protein